MAKKKDEYPVSANIYGLRSGRETSSRKQTTSTPVNSRRSEITEKHTSPGSSPVKNKLEQTEKQMGPSPLRRSDRGKKMVEIPNIESTKEKTEKNSKQYLKDVDEVDEVDKTEKQNLDVGGRKRKRFTAIHYKASFKPQRISIESDYDENSEVKDESPQDNTSRNEDVDTELETENSIGDQGALDKDCETVVEERVIDSDQNEVGDCPQTKSLDRKSVESGDVDKNIGGNVSPCNGNIASSDNHMVHTSSNRVEPDLENQQEPDTCHKVAETQKSADVMENAENNDVTSNMQNSKFIEFWVPIQISNVQLEQYCATLLTNSMTLCSSSKSDALGAFNNMYIANRKCCNHPYIVNAKLQDSLMKNKGQSTVLDVDVKASGKLQFLDHILPEIQKQHLKVLILFQSTSGNLDGGLPLGDILYKYVSQRYGQNSFEQVDGTGPVSTKKQPTIHAFNKDPSKFILLIESRSCHLSVRLSSLDVIIIFDSETNPLNDIKLLQKLSIDSRLKQIMVFRLYSSSTLEEKIFKLAEHNIAIDIRSQTLRCPYDALLTYGASDLFDKLTEFHSQTVSSISSDESFLRDVVEEFLYIVSHKCKRSDTTSKSRIIQAQNGGSYGKNIMYCEMKTHLTEGQQPYIFWRKLLERRSPIWKFVSESTSRQRKRPNYCSDSPPRETRTRRRTVNINSTVEPGRLKTVTETVGENGGGPTANDEFQSLSGDHFWSTEVNDEPSVLDLLKPTVSELCNILKLLENVKMIVETFLEFVCEYCNVIKDHTSALHALMISLCWIGSLLGENIIDRSESFAIAKKHFNFICSEEEAESAYEKLKAVTETYLEKTKILDRLKQRIPALKEVEPEINKSQSQHTHNAENHESCENVSKKGNEEFEKFKKTWDEKRASLEDDYNKDKMVIHAVYGRTPAIRAEHLIILKRKFTKQLEEHERLREISREELKASMLAVEGQVAAENGSHSGNPEVGPTLDEIPNEVQSLDEPVCEGANDIESTGSHTSEKEMVDATVCSKQIGEVPAQQDDDDMDVDVVDKVDSSDENAKSSCNASGPVIDHNETGAKDVAPRVGSGDMDVPAGDDDNESDEDCDVGLDTSRIVEDGHDNIDDVAPEVECVEMGTTTAKDHKETDANDVAPHGDMEMPAGSCNEENNEDGTMGLDTSYVVDDCRETVDDVALEVECADMRTPAGTCEQETDDIEEGEIPPDVGYNHNETRPDDVLPRAESAEMDIPAGTSDTENAEDGEITPDNETRPNDLMPIAESAEIGAPAGTCDKEIAEEGEIVSDTPNVDDNNNETGPEDVLTCGESAELAMPAVNEENAEDSIIRPDGIHVNEDHNGSNVNDSVCATLSHDNTPSVEPVSSPAPDHLEPIIPEIQNEPLQVSDYGVEDEEINNGDLQLSVSNQLDQLILDVEPEFPSTTDPMVVEFPSDPPSPNGSLLEPICEDPNLTMLQSGETLQENLAADADNVETPHEENERGLATSVAPAPPPVNPLDMFDNLTNRVRPHMLNQTDPLQAEVDRLYMVKDIVTKMHQNNKQKLNAECAKEIEETVTQIKQKYKAKHEEADSAYVKKKMDLDTNIEKVNMNKILAEAFRSKCQDVNPSGHTGMQQVSRAGLLQQACRLPSPVQFSGNQQPPQSLPQPPPLQPPQPRQPLQIVHQSAALFSSRPAPVVNQVNPPTPPTTASRPPPSTTPITASRPLPSTTPTTTSRPPPVINHITSSTTPTATSRPPPVINNITSSTTPTTTSRPPPVINHITPSTVPTASRPRPTSNPNTPSSAPATTRPPSGFNTTNPSPMSNRPPLTITQINMSAANLRISTETRGQASHTRPLVSYGPRAPAPHTRPLVNSQPRAPAPHMRTSIINEPRAPAPHLRSIPRVRPFTLPPSIIPPSTSSLPSEPVILPPQPPPPSEPFPMPPPPPPSSEQTPLSVSNVVVCLSDDE